MYKYINDRLFGNELMVFICGRVFIDGIFLVEYIWFVLVVIVKKFGNYGFIVDDFLKNNT